MKEQKIRLDMLLVERGLAETREKAKRAIMAGMVYSNEERLDKPGDKVLSSIPLTLKGEKMPYVSRGGYKLEKALKEFNLTVKDKVMIDIGSSTGGFTDCALQNGAKYSYAVDVGYNQLAWKLRQDERVVVMERTNFRYLQPEDLSKERPEFASIDVSFISLRLIFPTLKKLLIPGSDVVALIKPQFEAGRELVGKKGVIRDPKVHKLVVNEILEFSISQGYDVMQVTYSPITGGDGNIEFLLHLKWLGERETGMNHIKVTIDEIIKEAHDVLAKTKREG